jgi:hypothetical protein
MGPVGPRGDIGDTGLTGGVGLTGGIGLHGPAGDPGEVTVIESDGETIITGPAGLDGKDAKFEFQRIRVNDGVYSIVLPDPTTIAENGINYYKDSMTETDTTFTLSNGLVVGKFYAMRMQNMLFLKSGNLWIN